MAETDMSGKPYTDHAFAGIKPFTESLEEAGIPFNIMNDSSSRVFKDKSGILSPGEDTVKVGNCVKNGLEMFFSEFGIRITRGHRSYVVFIYDHMPTQEELDLTAGDIEGIIMERLDNVDLNAIIEQGERVN